MTFRDLPKNTDDSDFRDPVLGADLVDLLVGMRDRRADSFLFIPCWPDGRQIGKKVTVINDVPWAQGPAWFVGLWSTLAVETVGEFTLLLATSHGGLGVPEVHRDWLASAVPQLAALGTPVIGTYVAAVDDVHTLRPPELENA